MSMLHCMGVLSGSAEYCCVRWSLQRHCICSAKRGTFLFLVRTSALWSFLSAFDFLHFIVAADSLPAIAPLTQLAPIQLLWPDSLPRLRP